MLLKDCPVGSVVRLVYTGCIAVYFSYWEGQFVVQSDESGVFVIDGNGRKRRDVVDNPRFQFEIVLPAPEPTPEPRITFTVGGKEFYVGQRVWALKHFEGDVNHPKVRSGDELEIVAFYYASKTIVTRTTKCAVALFFLPHTLSTTPPTPHEWKRGDWARHEDGRECFVCGAARPHGAYGPVSLVVSFEGEAITNIPASEFAFIKHIDLPS